ncbi:MULTISPECIES: cell division protein CpoB [Symbiopectobacterium]|uniref:cell division protein CpoB n=1 Tax=Symbiopectobacterium TaxID=801 RepID=UPI001A17FE97|nr:MULTISPECIES: cell division protein CpoB [Symbiopectobacterium]MBG6247588.1 cell division protein CpoB [Candidatus Symbiopectobacterium sp. PLON1]MBT9429706.1 cell division protein CpoB [Candidatus Symbiopectobacterium endolongispinus]
MNSNFRRHLVGLSLLVGVAVPWAATAQAPISNVGSGSVEDRVTQMERISNAHSQLLTQLQQQLSDTQRDIDSLRGQIQENQNQLNQVVERQKQIYQQMDSMGSSSSTPSVSSAPATDTGASTSSPAINGAGAAAAPASTGDANSDYSAAAALVLEKKQYDQAIAAFQAFVKKYPDSTYQQNANYWLGQLNYNKGKKDDAAYYFANVVKNYPKSPKSSEALLKVGVIMQEKGQTDKAKAVYQQVIKQYPNTESAKQAQKWLTGL